jgi:hypothetical protein
VERLRAVAGGDATQRFDEAFGLTHASLPEDADPLRQV